VLKSVAILIDEQLHHVWVVIAD